MKRSAIKAIKAKDGWAFAKEHSKQMRAKAKLSGQGQADYLKYYYEIPFRLRKLYGLPAKAPKFKRG